MRKLKAEFIEWLQTRQDSFFTNLAEELANGEPTTAIRLNTLKGGAECPMANMEGNTPVPWCPEGVYLPSRPDFTLDPALHQGRYYVQDPSSMIITHVMQQLINRLNRPLSGENDDAPIRYLDACAAPGGKTTAALQALPPESFVVANEYDFLRAEILKENIIKWGSVNVVVSRGDTSRLAKLSGFFNIISADVPCSGEGMMRKDPAACEQWSPALVKQCAGRQQQIVDNLWEALAPGGYLIYSTCTFNHTENEEIMQYLIDNCDAEAVPPSTLAHPSWGVPQTSLMLRFVPGMTDGEGLAIGVLRKKHGTADSNRKTPYNEKKVNKNRNNTQQKAPAVITGLLTDGYTYNTDEEGVYHILPKSHIPLIKAISRHLDIIYYGVEAGSLKGKNFIPSHPAALSTNLATGIFPTIEVDLSTALNYLRRESLSGFDAPAGTLLLTYGGYPLGFVNNLGNRANNLYPQTWRIRKQNS